MRDRELDATHHGVTARHILTDGHAAAVLRTRWIAGDLTGYDYPLHWKGRIVGASKIARDITERRRAQEQQQLLIDEIKHRIKNTLTTVQSIAVHTLRSTSAEEREAFVGRLRALAGAHDLVTLESCNRASVHDIVCRALEAFQEEHRERFLISGPRDVWLNASKSLLLAMALYELGTNAVKLWRTVKWQRLGER